MKAALVPFANLAPRRVARPVHVIPLLLALAAVLLVLSPSAVEAGRLIAWGYNTHGESTLPAEAQSGVIAIAAGAYHGLAVKDGEVIAWGQNSNGQCNVPAAAQSGVIAIAAGNSHSLALTEVGKVIAWGSNNFGQITVPPAAQAGVIAIAAGEYHSLALKDTGAVLAWGRNTERQVGDAPTGTGFTAIAAGTFHSLALTDMGEVIAWGWNNYGQTTVPADLPTVTAIAAGYYYSLALTETGKVIAWGDNGEGQCNAPAAAQSGVIAIAGGWSHSLALTEAGQVLAWGRNDYGQCTVPAEADSGVIAIAGGSYYSLALLALQVDFSGSPTGGTAPLTVSFTDLSTDSPTAWQWEFGDGGASTDQHPTHTYLTPGMYTVRLTAANADGENTETKPFYISVTAAPPVADFFGNPASGPVPLTVQFTDQSTNNPSWWEWDFGDTGTSSLQHPSHEYTSIGQFTVSLTVANAGGWDTETKTDYITVTLPPPVAEFSATPTSGAVPLTVEFTDLSTNSPTAWEWEFGDGGASSEQNPSYTYVLAGVYTPSMTATNAGGSDTETKARYIVVNFVDVPADNWGYDEIMSCAAAGIVAGYPGGRYEPSWEVTRAQMAAYISRALAGGEENVPEGPMEPTFGDVAADHWAYSYVEYCLTNGIVQGYWDGYHPGEVLNRAQMAVFIARSMATPTGEAGLVSYDPPASPTFPDVPNTSSGSRGTYPFWAYTHIEYCVEHGVVQGYADGNYHPEYTVTRDQMAVYISRAFGLAM